jgi:hypothetical protein
MITYQSPLIYGIPFDQFILVVMTKKGPFSSSSGFYRLSGQSLRLADEHFFEGLTPAVKMCFLYTLCIIFNRQK